MLFGLALAPAGIGLAAFFMGAGFTYFIILTAISLLAYLLLLPKDQEIQDPMRQAGRLQQ